MMESTTVVETSAGAATTELPPELRKPLVTAEEGEKKKMRVLVAIDESDLSLYALKWALDHLFTNSSGATSPELGQLQDSDTITVVHVLQPYQPYVVPVGLGVYNTPHNVLDSITKARSENAAALLSRALKMCKDKNVRAETLILEGEVKDMICEAVEQMDVDLLVLGSRGLGMIKRALLGSISDYCVHHAKCPTLIVKPPKESHHMESHDQKQANR